MSDKKKVDYDVAMIAETKDGKNLIFRALKDVNLKEGDVLYMNSVKKGLEYNRDNGKISEEKFEELVDKLSWKKYTLNRPLD